MIIWISFIIMVGIFLILDLFVFNRKAHVIDTKEASKYTALWVGIALLFTIAVYFIYDYGAVANPDNLTAGNAAIKYLTGYLIELSLSIDNIFVIAVIFKSFAIQQKYQHRVLFWGIVGALVFRALMILFGVALISQVSWMTYVFGAFLLYTAFKMLTSHDEEFDPKQSAVYKLARKMFPVTDRIDGQKLFVRKMGKRIATPLFLALVVIELTDVLFALDSIPAILAITADPFLVFASNILAIMGLRSMYFFLSNLLDKFQYIHYSLVAILAFVGIKMILVHHFHFPEWVSLGFIFLALGVGMLFSSLKKTTKKDEQELKESLNTTKD
ncbi:TerC family protein [Nonlabens ponticola]|uniref:TerC family protein n=1 Tax=Nonlabens ponticola TaxID=2496866 RepID=A0A3S9MYU5_9FLAO|nr:TerC family protein [Nonlabens ponticola]AZQ44360.1 TerC family protein [Nonlabens ponticola]